MAIADMLPANPTLRTLNLSSCGIKTGTIIGLATALREHPSLTSLNIDKPLLPGVQEGLSVATHLSGMIKVNTALTELHMSKWKMNDDQLELMLPSLTANKGLSCRFCVSVVCVGLLGGGLRRVVSYHLAWRGALCFAVSCPVVPAKGSL